MVVSMFTKRRARKLKEGSGPGAQRSRSGHPLYFFFFRGRRHSLQAAGSRAKDDSVLEFWFGAGVVVALAAVVVVVCLHSLNVVG